ncbi:MAG: phosphoribosyltransferase [Rhodoglobus sp.]
MLFRDRSDAGQKLAAKLNYLTAEKPIILGLPRGGVPVAAQVAQALDAPLDVIVVRKLGVPYNDEFAMGAIGENVEVLNEGTIRALGVTREQLQRVRAREEKELGRRLVRFRNGRPPLDLHGRTAVVVDDGIATGATARAACQVVRALGATRVVLAVPVSSSTFIPGDNIDEFVSLHRPAHFMAIGQWYTDFAQTTDDEVLHWLGAS